MEIALVEEWGKGLEGQAPPMANSITSLDSLWPPCLVIYLQLNSGDGRGQVFHLDKKKRALLKGTDLSITLFSSHGAFIAFLSNNPFPFLNHNNSPPPLSPSSQEILVVSLYFHRHLHCCTRPLKSCELLAEAKIISFGPSAKLGDTGFPSFLGTHTVPCLGARLRRETKTK